MKNDQIPKNFPASPDEKEPIIQITQLSDTQIEVKVKGNGGELAMMFLSALESYPDLMPIFMSGLSLYCQKHKISLATIEKIAAAIA